MLIFGAGPDASLAKYWSYWYVFYAKCCFKLCSFATNYFDLT